MGVCLGTVVGGAYIGGNEIPRWLRRVRHPHCLLEGGDGSSRPSHAKIEACGGVRSLASGVIATGGRAG